MVFTYIPEKANYENDIPKLNKYDQFNKDNVKNTNSLEERFKNLTYDFLNTNSSFYIIRNEKIA